MFLPRVVTRTKSCEVEILELKTVNIHDDPALKAKAKALYMRAFPREERLPWWILCLNSRREGIDLTAFLDGETFCGFTASVTVGSLHFLLFFAVEDPYRCMGYGSAILQKLQDEFETLVLNVEPLLPDAPNLSQRERRFAFYRRNGLIDTGYHVWEVGGKFRVLSTKQELDVPAYKKIFRKLTLGVWDVRLQKAEDE